MEKERRTVENILELKAREKLPKIEGGINLCIRIGDFHRVPLLIRTPLEDEAGFIGSTMLVLDFRLSFLDMPFGERVLYWEYVGCSPDQKRIEEFLKQRI